MIMVMMMIVSRVVLVVVVVMVVGGWGGRGTPLHTQVAAQGMQPVPAGEQEIPPKFLEPVANVTVSVGREASLTCSVDHLGQHKVAWIHLDRKMIVSIHNHVITRLPRFTVSHDSHKTWRLHVSHVREEDRGHYMCQVNTDPMMSQTGYLQVFVPPTIVDADSSKSNIVVREKENVTLRCRGDGFPAPQIKWKREDGQPIQTSDGRKVAQHEGGLLELRQVSRTHMAAYFCIASNGIPPSVSKRITLDVEFAPQMHVPNQLVGAPLGTDVNLECFVEAHPRAITYWDHRDAMVMNTSRLSTHTLHDRYKISMTLSIRDLQDADFGLYKCISKNSISETDGSITLNKTFRPTTPPYVRIARPRHHDEEARYRIHTGRQEVDEEHLQRAEEEAILREERRREEEAARQEVERQRLERYNNQGHRGDHPTRVTTAPGGGVSGGITGSASPSLTLLLCLVLLPTLLRSLELVVVMSNHPHSSLASAAPRTNTRLRAEARRKVLLA